MFLYSIGCITETHPGSVALKRNSILSEADQILSGKSCLQMQGSSCVYLRALRGQRLPGEEHQRDEMDGQMGE